jgi:hypothetical protein
MPGATERSHGGVVTPTLWLKVRAGSPAGV